MRMRNPIECTVKRARCAGTEVRQGEERGRLQELRDGATVGG